MHESIRPPSTKVTIQCHGHSFIVAISISFGDDFQTAIAEDLLFVRGTRLRMCEIQVPATNDKHEVGCRWRYFVVGRQYFRGHVEWRERENT